MNIPVKPPSPGIQNAPATAQPHRFTVNDVLAMVKAGVIQEGARVELIEGELLDMAAEGSRHIDYVGDLGRWLYGALDQFYMIVPGSTLVLSDRSGPKPDWYVFPAAMKTEDVRGPDVLLAIEVSDSTTAYDLGDKANLYARHGVREYWVLHIENRQLFVHRDPAPEGYGFKKRYADDEAAEALLIPGLSLRLKDLSRVGAP